VSTPVTLSENTIAHWALEALVGLEPTRLMETALGTIESIDHVYDVAELVVEPLTARTWNVCAPWASGPA
jgi:hypothetical protein